MKRTLKYFIIIFIMLILPTKAKAITYSIEEAIMKDTELSIKGWAYFVNKNFCNSDNGKYKKYKTDDNGAVANKCSGKGYNSVKYQLYLVPVNGNADRIYFKNNRRDSNNQGSVDNLRYNGVSATCVNYYKGNVKEINKETGEEITKVVHCDGVLSQLGEIPDEPITYIQRNKNVQTNAGGGGESYFYDDIGFSGYVDLNELVPEVKYTLYLDIILDGGTPQSFNITMPGINVSTGGDTTLDSKDSNGETTYVGPNETKYILGSLPESGTINQDYTMPYYIDDSVLKQKGKTQGGGYFREGYSYFVNSTLYIEYILGVHNYIIERTGGFKFFQLGTTGIFENKYIYPGTKNKDYYAIAPWLDFSGSYTIVRHVKEECGGTKEGLSDRIAYCNNTPKPDDYNTCCQDKQVGICEEETTDQLKLITSTPYTYWDTTPPQGVDVETELNTKNESIQNYPKYCSNKDFTNTMYNDAYRDQAIQAFCYQEGGFTTSSNTKNEKNYILTYTGGAYTLNVEYNTRLVCTSLDNRTITEIRYYDPGKTCSKVGTVTLEGDAEVKFLDEVSDGNKLNYNKNGIFDVNVDNDVGSLVSKIKNVPTLVLKDTTADQNEITLESKMTITKSGNLENMNEYIKNANNGSDPRTNNSFVQKLELTKKITSEDGYGSDSVTSSCSFESPSSSCNATTDEKPDKTKEYAKDYYYGKLDLTYGEVKGGCDSDKETGKGGCSYTAQYSYTGTVKKLMYVTIRDNYKTEYVDLNFKYTIPPEAIPQSIRDRFENADGEKYVSQINLSDYYQIIINSKDYKKGSGEGFGIASNWDIDKALCILDVTSFPKVCDPSKEECGDLPYCDPSKQNCKDDNDTIGDHYTDTFAYRIVSTTALFPGKDFSRCKNPTGGCRQPGRNWNNYLKSDQKSAFLLPTNIDYTPETPMYHITLSPSTMNKIISENKDYYTNITLGSWYNPKECVNSSGRCSSDYESDMLDKLGDSIFTRNRKIIYGRYKVLSQYGVNEYLTSKEVTE